MASAKHAVLIIKTELFSNPGSVTGQNDACQVSLEALTGCVCWYGADRHGTVVPTYPSSWLCGERAIVPQPLWLRMEKAHGRGMQCLVGSSQPQLIPLLTTNVKTCGKCPYILSPQIHPLLFAFPSGNTLPLSESTCLLAFVKAQTRNTSSPVIPNISSH